MGYSVSMEEPETPRSREGHGPWQDPFPQASLEEAGGRPKHPHHHCGEAGLQKAISSCWWRHTAQPTCPDPSRTASKRQRRVQIHLPYLGTRYSSLAVWEEEKQSMATVGTGEEPLPATAHRQGSTLLDKGQKQKYSALRGGPRNSILSLPFSNIAILALL